MPTYNDGYIQLQVSKLDDQRQRVVTLTAAQFQEGHLTEYPLFLAADDHYLAGTLQNQSDDQVQVAYTIPETAISLKKYLTQLTPIAVLALIPQTYWLFDQAPDGRQAFIHPRNLYVIGNQIVAMHRGFNEVVAPNRESEEQRVAQLRALALWMIDPSLDYGKLVAGEVALKTTLGQELAKATTLAEIKQRLNEQVDTQVQINHQTEVTVKRRRYSLMKWVSWVASIIAVILIGLSLYWGLYTIPKQSAIIEAQADYQVANYSQVTSDLKRYGTRSLPQAARYILAVSYIKQDSLSADQQKVVLKNISQKSAAIQLNYWIYIGRADYQRALSLAKNMGDNEYILHAYAKLYTETKNDDTMNGATKQKRLNNYRKQINAYIKKLGGSKNEFESN
ncbi:MAG: type VII secretion protein EssB [Limosilactobacillus fermentum]|uniref:type VII secretion protein EssB n=1 Tax=Limosilactobacillus fermentum TaxID=1613 RepID=UPI0022EBC9E6|nr:type VII secretion protein EssB [Limosilactobacillus fermentum]MDA3723568.1 type VII secretion protein EssB [Limosilactobacillus fermentum]MDA3762103.1 type VII secretion protein EssB [Limosilactobacillus fermentum]